MRGNNTKVGVEVNDWNGAIDWVNRTKYRKDDGVVTTKSNNSRMVLSIKGDGDELLPSERVITQRRESLAMKQSLVTLLYLLDSKLVVIWPWIILCHSRNAKIFVHLRDWDIATIYYPETRIEGVNLQRNVVSAIQRQTTRTCAYSGWVYESILGNWIGCKGLTWSEPSSRPITGPSVLQIMDSEQQVRSHKEALTNGAPMKAMSKGTWLSLVRHWTHGSLANVVMPEKIASAVTATQGNQRQPCIDCSRLTFAV